MLKLTIVVMDSVQFDHAKSFERAVTNLGIQSEIVPIPYFRVEQLTSKRLKDLKRLLREQSKGARVIFCPGLAEFFLPEADRLFVFSAYRNWYQPEKVRVLPHIWTLVSPVTSSDLVWDRKPPLRIGFMGTAYSNSRLANAISRSPQFVKHWFLRGTYLRHLGLLAQLYQRGVSLKLINTFARFETLRVLRTKQYNYPDAQVQIIDREGFGGTDEEMALYASHMQNLTYVICPRGSENFSIRAYEALKFGRIPVIIDTNMVLPTEIDWARVSVRVPYEALGDIYDIILNDYRSRSTQQFIMRQREAFSVVKELESMHWLEDLLIEELAR